MILTLLNTILKEIFDYARVNLIVYSNVTIKQCSELFRDVNTMVC